MRSAASARMTRVAADAGVACVAVRFVDDGEFLRLERIRQTRDNSFLHRHAFALPFAGRRHSITHVGVRQNVFFTAVSIEGGRVRRRNWGLPDDDHAHKRHDMNLNSPLFVRIRVKPARSAPEKPNAKIPCSHPGCQEEGVFRAPKGRDREGEYFSFCKDHVREYNATYDYFRGMDDESMAKFR